MDMVRVTGSIQLVSMDQEGIDWLNENFPDWQDHIGYTSIKTEVNISNQVIQAMGPEELLSIITHELTYELAEEILKVVEPKIKGLDETARIRPRKDNRRSSSRTRG